MAVALLLAYDGTDFHGYQRQAAAYEPTVQGMLETALQRLCGAAVPTAAAGRTDAGVHAQGQVVTFLPPQAERFAEHDWQRALNALVPMTIAVRSVALVADSVHARFSALSRRYRYRVVVAPVRDPLRERFAHRVPFSPDFSAMRAACAALQGEHDFAAFGHSPSDEPGQPKRHTVRRLIQAEASEHGDEIWFDFTANAFLTGMVRRMMGTVLLVGAGRMPLATVAALLATPGEQPAVAPAPAHGLCLMQVTFPPGTIAWPAELR
jgi:tRNA pseudouridine38-40 synthase